MSLDEWEKFRRTWNQEWHHAPVVYVRQILNLSNLTEWDEEKNRPLRRRAKLRYETLDHWIISDLSQREFLEEESMGIWIYDVWFELPEPAVFGEDSEKKPDTQFAVSGMAVAAIPLLKPGGSELDLIGALWVIDYGKSYVLWVKRE